MILIDLDVNITTGCNKCPVRIIIYPKCQTKMKCSHLFECNEIKHKFQTLKTHFINLPIDPMQPLLHERIKMEFTILHLCHWLSHVG